MSFDGITTSNCTSEKTRHDLAEEKHFRFGMNTEDCSFVVGDTWRGVDALGGKGLTMGRCGSEYNGTIKNFLKRK
jgi:hypothetical protein